MSELTQLSSDPAGSIVLLRMPDRVGSGSRFGCRTWARLLLEYPVQDQTGRTLADPKAHSERDGPFLWSLLRSFCAHFVLILCSFCAPLVCSLRSLALTRLVRSSRSHGLVRLARRLRRRGFRTSQSLRLRGERGWRARQRPKSGGAGRSRSGHTRCPEGVVGLPGLEPGTVRL